MSDIVERLRVQSFVICGEAADEITRLRAQVAALEVDAGRYRWLRDDPPLNLAVRRFPAETVRGCYLDGYNLDAAIDAALAARGHKKKLGPTRALQRIHARVAPAMPPHQGSNQ